MSIQKINKSRVFSGLESILPEGYTFLIEGKKVYLKYTDGSKKLLTEKQLKKFNILYVEYIRSQYTIFTTETALNEFIEQLTF